MERMECLRLLSRTFDLGRQCPVWLHLSSASLALSLYLGDLLLLVVLVGASKGTAGCIPLQQIRRTRALQSLGLLGSRAMACCDRAGWPPLSSFWLL